MAIKDIARALHSNLGAGRVFGDPIERDGVTFVPAAHVIGGGGGGVNAGDEGNGGLGFGGIAWPAGGFEIRAGGVAWKPAADYRGALACLVIAVLVLASRSR